MSGERIEKALNLLMECLNDEEPWDECRLVERMEAVFSRSEEPSRTARLLW